MYVERDIRFSENRFHQIGLTIFKYRGVRQFLIGSNLLFEVSYKVKTRFIIRGLDEDFKTAKAFAIN